MLSVLSHKTLKQNYLHLNVQNLQYFTACMSLEKSCRVDHVRVKTEQNKTLLSTRVKTLAQQNIQAAQERYCICVICHKKLQNTSI